MAPHSLREFDPDEATQILSTGNSSRAPRGGTNVDSTVGKQSSAEKQFLKSLKFKNPAKSKAILGAVREAIDFCSRLDSGESLETLSEGRYSSLPQPSSSFAG